MKPTEWTQQNVSDERDYVLLKLGNAAAHLRGAHDSLVKLHQHGATLLSAEELEEIRAALNAAALLVNWEGRERHRAAALAAAEKLQKAEQQAREAEECYRQSRKAVDDVAP